MKIRQMIVAAAIAGGTTVGLYGIAAATAPEAPGDTSAISGCQDDLWITFEHTRRTICDGHRMADGGWVRAREFYTPAHRVPLRTNCYGRYSISCTTTGGYFQPRTSKGVETYIVYPHNRLHDEPDHLINDFR